MRTPKWLAGLAVGLLVLIGAVAVAPSAGFAQDDDDAGEQEGSPLGDPLLSPTMTIDEAQQAALDALGDANANVRSVELEGENGVLVWAVEFDNGAEVEIDDASGEVLETEQGDDDEDEDDD